MSRTRWLFVVSLVGMAVSAAVLIWLLPSLFRSGEHHTAWLYGLLAVLVAVFGAGVRRWRPATPTRHGT